MRKIKIICIIVLFHSLLNAQNNNIQIKDSDNNTLLNFIDEGTFGSIFLKKGLPANTLNKLYNDNGELSFNGIKLATTSSAGGWSKIDSIISQVDSTNLVGIGTDKPIGALHVSNNNGVIFTGEYNNGIVQNLGDGIRMHWYPHKASFRAGESYVDGWDDANIGIFSTAFGYHTIASGNSSFAAGSSTIASGSRSTAMGQYSEAQGESSTALGGHTTAAGNYSTVSGYYSETSGLSSVAMGEETTAQADHSIAMGYYTSATGNKSVAMGNNTQAIGSESLAMGLNSIASGPSSVAMGSNTIASGNYSVAMGSNTVASESNATALGSSTTASGVTSTAMGYWTTASGNYSTALGARVEAAGTGTFFFGDNTAASPQTKSVDNRFYARFGNGYKLYTDAGLTVGAQMLGGANSWSIISDSTKKENFRLVNGEEVLNKISKFNLRSWNYKSQDPSLFRHYGPMAQEFFNAFGHDGIGTIGNDTTIASADFDGINLIAIQALEKRTREQDVSIKMQDERIKKLEEENEKNRIKNLELINLNAQLLKSISQIEIKYKENRFTSAQNK